jgi:uncharacterized protein YdaU (DUF1376 family)
MHYYSHHIDSYTSATRHLLPLEDLAYRRMLDVYYRDERPLQGDAAAVARRIGLRENVAEVRAVLDEFFVFTPEGWRQVRCDAEIAEYQQAAQRNRVNGARGGRPRGTGKQPGRNPGGAPPDGDPSDLGFHVEPAGNPVGFGSVASGVPTGCRSEPGGNPPNPNPVPQSPVLSTQPPPSSDGYPLSGAGRASPDAGDGERGAEPPDPDPGERQAIFALLGATPLRSNSKNRRQILDEIAGAVVADGMGSDQARRLIAKAKAETKGDYGALLGEWFRPGAWRDTWAEIVSGRVGGLVAGIAARTRARA